MKIVFYLIILLSIPTLQSCSALRPSADLSISNDRRPIEFLKDRSGSIDSLKAELFLSPSDIAVSSIDAYLSYEKYGIFRLIGLSPAGFTLFDIKVEDGVVTDTIGNFPVKETFTPGILMELIDFYGSDNSGDSTWFIEEISNFYVVTQLISSGGISYPLRRWWIDREKMVIIKKELYSDLPDNQGIRLFEALYRDFRTVNGINTPFEIIINNGIGRKTGKVRFKKIEYNEDKK